MAFTVRNTTAFDFLLQDSYISQPFAANESIDLETIWTYEQLHKSMYYTEGALGDALRSGILELIEPNIGYKDPVWRLSSPRIEYITLTQDQIDNKKIVLKETPNKDLLAVDILGGIAQFPDTDFIVTGRELSWDTLGMDALLETGDTLRVIYGS
jgi:hypothetical protein